MKTLNLFLKMHFTSLSPDGQPISLAIVTGEHVASKYLGVDGEVEVIGTKSFYAEFTDFDINWCDDWVKENVVSKLTLKNTKYENPILDSDYQCVIGHNWNVQGKIYDIKTDLKQWFCKFSDYKLNFIVDCGWFTWYKFIELMAEWDGINYYDTLIIPDCDLSDVQKKEICENWSVVSGSLSIAGSNHEPKVIKQGLPKLPENLPPVPIDLNDLIMDRKGFKSSQDAFNLDREELAFGFYDNAVRKTMNKFKEDELAFFGFKGENKDQKYNALWDAKITKIIYEKLK